MSKLHAKRDRKLRKVEEEPTLEFGVMKPTKVFAIPSPPLLDTSSLGKRKEKKKSPQMSFTMSASLARELFDI